MNNNSAGKRSTFQELLELNQQFRVLSVFGRIFEPVIHALRLHMSFTKYIFITAFAEYILMAPSEAYKPFMDTMREKIHMSKVLIEFLQRNPIATYEDLLNKIQVG